ncbi:MAG: hypothetical protein KDB87_13115, partial [Flavobacteriales bacterium]|nr:hypothetical protein [Flavobacteriales bacterium]
MRQIALLLVLGSTLLQAQSVTPFVDHWDSTRTVKKSEGLLVNGREWGEWTFWDPQGRKTEVAEFEAGQREGHVVIYYTNGQVQHDGYFHMGKPDSLKQSFYRDGTPMERGLYVDGKKTGTWEYW